MKLSTSTHDFWISTRERYDARRREEQRRFRILLGIIIVAMLVLISL